MDKDNVDTTDKDKVDKDKADKDKVDREDVARDKVDTDKVDKVDKRRFIHRFCRFSHRCCGNYLLIFSPIFLPISLTMFSPFLPTHLPFFSTDCFAAFSTDFSTDYFANFCCLFANILPILVLIILLIFHK